MCGIFGYIGNKKASKILLDGLKDLEYRGYDSWGVAVKNTKNQIQIIKHTGKIGSASLENLDGTSGIGHTRWATHGGVTVKNAHPHESCNGKVVIVHNGIVENYTKLKNKLINQGHKFVSETDSEVIAHLLEDSLSRNKSPFLAMKELKNTILGLNAVIAFFTNEEIIGIYKNGSPIVVSKTETEFFVASDQNALSNYSNKMYFVEDGEIVVGGAQKIEFYNSNNKFFEPTFQNIPKTEKDLNLLNFKHFMLKEISEQPNIIKNIINNQAKEILDVAEKIKNSFGVYLVGCGTASFASLAGVYFFSKIARRHINSAFGSEFSYLLDFVRRQTLVIALSQSGETIDTISSVKLAKEKGATLVSITNSPHSTLDRLSNKSLYLNAGPEKAVASTKAYTAKLAYLFLIAHTIGNTLSMGVKQLQKAVKETENILKDHSEIINLAKKLTNEKNIFILGRGVSYALSLESALKIKEVSYTHAEGFAGGELKHGVIALIEKGTPVIVYNPTDETYEDTLSASYEVKARGAMVIGVSSKNSDSYDVFIPVKYCGDATIIPQVVIAQLLSYYLALSRGVDPDKPRNLAKSVTVK